MGYLLLDLLETPNVMNCGQSVAIDMSSELLIEP